MKDEYAEGTMLMKKCSRCGLEFMKEYNKKLCPDCAAKQTEHVKLSSLGCEDMVSHFKQDVGLRLQRKEWGHFD